MAKGSNCKNFSSIQQPYHNLYEMKHSLVWMLVQRLRIIPFRHWLVEHEYDPEYLVLTLAAAQYSHFSRQKVHAATVSSLSMHCTVSSVSGGVQSSHICRVCIMLVSPCCPLTGLEIRVKLDVGTPQTQASKWCALHSSGWSMVCRAEHNQRESKLSWTCQASICMRG